MGCKLCTTQHKKKTANVEKKGKEDRKSKDVELQYKERTFKKSHDWTSIKRYGMYLCFALWDTTYKVLGGTNMGHRLA